MPDGSDFGRLADPGNARYEIMSPSLLADEPPTINSRPREEFPWWPLLYNHLESRRNALRSWRWSWLMHWHVLASLFLPRRWAWFAVVANRMWRGAPVNDQIINSEGLQAVRTCASGFFVGTMSPSRPWFEFGIALPWVTLDQAGKDWLEDATARVRVVMDQSNWNISMPQMCKDMVVLGTAPVIIYEDKEDVVRLYNPSPGEYYLGVGARLTTDTLYREYVQTILQVVEFAGLENCPSDIQALWQNKGGSLDGEVVVCHAIEPNFPLSQPGKKQIGRAHV